MENQKSELVMQIEEAVSFIRNKTDFLPDVGIILGTGLDGLAKELQIDFSIAYEEIPHFPLSTVEFHSGKLLFGTISGKKVIAMQGRFHFYEGYTMKQITFPIRVLKALGVNTLFISNACGSMNPYFRKGHLMLIDDHINLLGDNPLRGVNDEQLGKRFPDMSEPYSQRLIKLAEETALENNIMLYKGIYAAMCGPSFETRAEYRFLRTIGADVIGMSTIPEVIVAKHAEMEVLGVSVITDECYPETLKAVDISEIIAAANKAEPNLTLLMKKLIGKL